MCSLHVLLSYFLIVKILSLSPLPGFEPGTSPVAIAAMLTVVLWLLDCYRYLKTDHFNKDGIYRIIFRLESFDDIENKHMFYLIFRVDSAPLHIWRHPGAVSGSIIWQAVWPRVWGNLDQHLPLGTRISLDFQGLRTVHTSTMSSQKLDPFR